MPGTDTQHLTNRMSYARSRLWLGITGVGTWVTIAFAGIYWQWGSHWQDIGGAAALAVFVSIYALVQAPFDYLGGVLLPRWHSRPQTTFRGWARGVAVQALLWWMASMLLYSAGASAGLPGATAAMAMLMMMLIVGQGWIARLVADLQPREEIDATQVLESRDPAFVGGWVGIGPARKLLLPAAWNEATRAVQHTRRHAALRQGTRSTGLLAAFTFNVTGLAVSCALTPGAGFASPGEYLHLVFGFTLWSFLGLLTLPSISRPAVFLADREAERQGLDWETAARRLDQLQDDEPARAVWIERIFHPVPSVNARLARPRPRWGAWQAARLALYLSWPVPGLLARSVHCNAGRPDLWVLFPGD